MKITAILNSRTRRNKTTIKRKLKKAFSDIEILETTCAEDATKFAKKCKSDIVIAIGGDGTVNEVINGIIGKKVSLGIIPAGTSNILARAYDIPKDVDKAIKLIEFMRKKRIDVGKINERHFVIAAGIGIDAETYKNVEPDIKKIFGEVAYPISLLKTIFKYNPKKLTIEVNGKKKIGYYALFCNVGKINKVFKILPEAKEDDGFLDVLVFTKKDIVAQFRYIYSIVAQQRKQFKDIIYFRAKKIKVKSEEPVLIHADAELVGKTPVTVEIKEGALELIC